MPPASIRLRPLLLFLLLPLLAAPAGRVPPRLPREARRETRFAVRLARRGLWGEAEAHLRRALAAAPGHPGLLHDLGVVLRARGRDRAAGELLERARAAGFVPGRRCRKVRIPRPRPAIVPLPEGAAIGLLVDGEQAEEVATWVSRTLERRARIGMAGESVPAAAILELGVRITVTDRSGYEEEDDRDDPFLLEPSTRARWVVRKIHRIELRVKVRDRNGAELHHDEWTGEVIDRGLRDRRDILYDLLAPFEERLVAIFRPGRQDEPACLWAG